MQFYGDFLEYTNFTVKLRQWIPVCMAVDFEVRNIKLLFEDRVVNFRFQASNQSRLGIRGGGNLVLGQDQDSFNSGYVQMQSLSGSLADFRIYGHVLSDQELEAFGKCKSTLIANSTPIISFSNVQRDFEALNVQLERIKKQDYCMGERSDVLIFPEIRTFEEAKYICYLSGGALAVPTSEETSQLIFNISMAYAERCNSGYVESFWLGVAGNVINQSWNHYITGKDLSYTNFINGKYPIREPFVCVSFVGNNNVIKSQHRGWFTTDCSGQRCPICHQEKVLLLRARGFCKGSLFDRHYFFTHDKGRITFTGIYYSVITIYFTSDKEHANERAYDFWRLSRLDKPSVRATLQVDSPDHYPYGRHTWAVENDVCGKNNLTILITSCKNGQFTCTNGACIKIQRRCDLEIDCPDGSDEMDCNFLSLDRSYNSDNPPPRTNESSPVSVKFSIDIYAIRSIDVDNFRFTCDVEVATEWFDSRLQFRHLNYASALNSLNRKERQPWRPRLEFLGDARTTSDVETRRSSLNIRRYSGPLEDNDEEAQESEILFYSILSLSFTLSIHPSVCLFIHLSVSPSLYLSISLFMCLSISLSLCAYLFIYVLIYRILYVCKCVFHVCIYVYTCVYIVNLGRYSKFI